MTGGAASAPEAAPHDAIVSPEAREMLAVPARDLRLVPLSRLTRALEASWDSRTAYLGAASPGNAALGQCYPTARVVQWFFPELEIVRGEVDTGSSVECHFWNIGRDSGILAHVDLSWAQFPAASVVRSFEVLDRTALDDSQPTIARCRLLLDRVLVRLAAEQESA
ncbi:MAG TPA: hypothetical protein VF582_00545 [Allosphingosinicella sp.]|jgi:hypothetical protein